MNPFSECTTEQEVSDEHKRLRLELQAERDTPYKERFDRMKNQARSTKRDILNALDKATIDKVSDWQRGEKIYLDEISKSSIHMFTKGIPMTDHFHEVTHGKMVYYQPKNKIVWLVFTKKQVTGSQWHHRGLPMQPFYLSDVRRYNMRRTDV